MMMTIGGLPHPETNLALVFVTSNALRETNTSKLNLHSKQRP